MLTSAAAWQASTPHARGLLRRETARAHQRLHGVPAFAALRNGTISPDQYRRLLLRLFGLHAPIEAILAPFQTSRDMGWHDAMPELSRSARLLLDLRMLGIDPATALRAPSASHLLPALPSRAAALGCAWVIEGSALGGRVLANVLNDRFGMGAANGAAFFAPLPWQSQRWAACCAAVEACGSDPLRLASMVAAAQEIFNAFADWMEGHA